MYTLECPMVNCQSRNDYPGALGLGRWISCAICKMHFEVDTAKVLVSPTPPVAPPPSPSVISVPSCTAPKGHHWNVIQTPGANNSRYISYSCKHCNVGAAVSDPGTPPAAPLFNTAHTQSGRYNGYSATGLRNFITVSPKSKHESCDTRTCDIVHVNLMYSQYDYCRDHKKEVDLSSLGTNTGFSPPDCI